MAKPCQKARAVGSPVVLALVIRRVIGKDIALFKAVIIIDGNCDIF